MINASRAFFILAVQAVLLVLFVTGHNLDSKQQILQDTFNIVKKQPLALSDECPSINSNEVEFYLYDRVNHDNPILLNSNTDHIEDGSRDIKVIIHGWITYRSDDMKNAYLTKGDYIVIMVNWTTLAMVPYAKAYCNVPHIGEEVAKLIYRFGLDLNRVHLVGRSLGAQIAGCAGQVLQTLTGGQKLKRITGLAAAGPGFERPQVPHSKRLSADDAHFVDGIHTGNSGYDYEEQYATVDFYANNGTLQPGCPVVEIPAQVDDLEEVIVAYKCSHKRAAMYFTESINSDRFIATKLNSCSLPPCPSLNAIMGENCPTNISGRYDLTTRSEAPFAL